MQVLLRSGGSSTRIYTASSSRPRRVPRRDQSFHAAPGAADLERQSLMRHEDVVAAHGLGDGDRHRKLASSREQMLAPAVERDRDDLDMTRAYHDRGPSDGDHLRWPGDAHRDGDIANPLAPTPWAVHVIGIFAPVSLLRARLAPATLLGVTMIETEAADRGAVRARRVVREAVSAHEARGWRVGDLTPRCLVRSASRVPGPDDRVGERLARELGAVEPHNHPQAYGVLLVTFWHVGAGTGAIPTIGAVAKLASCIVPMSEGTSDEPPPPPPTAPPPVAQPTASVHSTPPPPPPPYSPPPPPAPSLFCAPVPEVPPSPPFPSEPAIPQPIARASQPPAPPPVWVPARPPSDAGPAAAARRSCVPPCGEQGPPATAGCHDQPRVQ